MYDHTVARTDEVLLTDNCSGASRLRDRPAMKGSTARYPDLRPPIPPDSPLRCSL